MARIAVVSSHPPFSEGGHLVLGRALVEACREAGHEAELVLTPQNRFGRQGAAYLANWLTDVGESDGRSIDAVVSLRYPAYAVRHPRHVCWLTHTMREYYDLWPAFARRISWKNRVKESIRRTLIRAVDRRLLAPGRVRALFTISRRVAERLETTLGLEAKVLYPPPAPRSYRCDEYGDFILGLSRLMPLKRFDLLIRAVATPAARAVQCIIAGDGPERGPLEGLARDLGVADRVRFCGRVSDERLLELLARCRAVCFLPRDEDYGFVTAEAFASRKPVVTCADAGGARELVEDGVSGLVVEPEPEAVGAALARLLSDPALSRRLGESGARRVSALTWPATVETLLDAAGCL